MDIASKIRLKSYSIFRGYPQIQMYQKDTSEQIVHIDTVKKRKVMQYLMNILGRYYEHQREDRKYYIIVNWEYVQEGTRNLFQ